MSASEPYTKTIPASYEYAYWTKGTNWLGSARINAHPVDFSTKPVYTVANWSNTLNGYKNRHWREEVRAQTQAGTPASGSYEVVAVGGGAHLEWVIPDKIGSGYYGRQVKHWKSSGVPVYRVYTAGGSASLSEANNLALTKLYNRIDSATEDLKVLVSMGEAAESMRMLRQPTESLKRELYRYLDDVKRQVKAVNRRRVPTRAAAVTRLNSVIAGLWLERQFGWKPLLSDIDSLFGSLTKIAQNMSGYEKPSIVVRAQGESVGTPAFATSSWSGINADAVARWRIQNRISVRYIAKVVLEPRDFSRTALDAFGLQWSEFVPTVWELIPYSFVVDYFTNIGSIVSASSVNTRRIAWIVKTTKTETVNRLEDLVLSDWNIASGSPCLKYVHARPWATARKGTFSRELPATLDLPSLEVGLSKVTPMKALNMLALARASRSCEQLIAHSLRHYRA